jgi:general secretion pathway protein J
MMYGRRLRGFTLLELLVVMGLLSAVMLALGAALRTIAQSEDRVDRRLAQADELRVASAFMRTTLGRVSARKMAPAPAPAPASGALAWVGVMPARYGQGGRQYFRLGIEPAGAEAALVLRFLPWTGASTFPDWSQAESRVLVRNATALQLRYEDTRKAPSTWTSEWVETKYLPARVELTLQTPAGAWPALVIPLRTPPDSESGGSSRRGVIGGSK